MNNASPGHGITLPNWEAFEEELKKLTADQCTLSEESNSLGVSDLLFRGQSDSTWHLETTLERFGSTNHLDVGNYYRAIHRAKPQIESLSNRRWDIQTPVEYEKWLADEDQQTFGLSELPAYDYMVYLRHHGFPSPVLDWSRSPYVAAYFAFRNPHKTVSHVAIYTYLEFTGKGKIRSLSEPHISSRRRYDALYHPRHFLQQSEYTICTRPDKSKSCFFYASHDEVFSRRSENQDRLWKFLISSSERMKVLRLLDRFNLNAYSLFGSEESLLETLALREILFRHDGEEF